MEVEIDNFPVSELPSRFNIGKQAIYNRLDALDIRPSKLKNRAYITADQLELLDRLQVHIVEGGTMADFQSLHGGTGQLDILDESSVLVEHNSEVLVNLLAGAVSQAIASTIPTRSPLWYMSELEAAQTQGWLLTTSEIQKLIGVKPTTAKGTSTYQRGSFSFVKAGKIGTQTAWKVTKNQLSEVV
jgi:hypothetical protein